ncbi:NAD+ synthase [Aureococcus anophagefferens]|nr:NAD+ synthase [Aureococcus anophagefferens]
MMRTALFVLSLAHAAAALVAPSAPRPTPRTTLRAGRMAERRGASDRADRGDPRGAPARRRAPLACVAAAFVVGVLAGVSRADDVADGFARYRTVADGDTFRARHTPLLSFARPRRTTKAEGGSLKLADETLQIRLYAVDAPETAKFGNAGEKYGAAATDFVADRVRGRRVRLRLLARDQYGRAVAAVRYGGFLGAFEKDAEALAGLATVAARAAPKQTMQSAWGGDRSFFDLHAHDFVRVSTCVPRVFLGDPLRNAAAIGELYDRAQDAILRETLEALALLKARTAPGKALLVVGAPLRVDGRLYNCAVVLHGGRALGVIPKSYLPNFREFYEARQFVSGRERCCGDVLPGTFLGEAGAFRGATVLCNLSASNITIDKSRYRHALVASMSSKNYCAYLYTSAGAGESTNDLAWDGQAVIYECGDLLGESERFADDVRGQALHGDVDLGRVAQDRSRDMTWSQNGRDFRDLVEKALDKLGLPRSNCLAYTMPGFATTAATKSYALELMRCLGVTAETLDITPSCEVMLGDLGHAYAAGERGRAVYDVTFENVQAGERTNHLFRLANHKGAFVVGTGDLSELALGWCTYGVGDHMSHYCVNASVPKSLIQCVIQWVISSDFVGAEANAVLTSILAVEISPELVPQEDGEAMQSTEDALGPDATTSSSTARARGFAPAKAAYLAMHAWASDCPDTWERAHFEREPPPTLAGAAAVLEDRAFPLAKVLDFQRTFLRRFFLTSQFKRTCVPNAPKVGDGGSLSPAATGARHRTVLAPGTAAGRRGEWARTPADGHAELARDLEALARARALITGRVRAAADCVRGAGFDSAGRGSR